MSNMCDNFIMYEDNQSDFKMWQGLVGAHYTPYVDGVGNLSWTNNGGLPNPPTVNVTGKGLTITGIAATTGDLPATANQFDCYLVGTAEPFSVYMYYNGAWVNIGEVGKGEQGEPGFSPVVTVSPITGGHQISITDAEDTETFNVMDGTPGQGIPTGGNTGQILKKLSNRDYDCTWENEGSVDPATATPLMDGTAAVGASTKYAREDHVHPTDTSRASATDLSILEGKFTSFTVTLASASWSNNAQTMSNALFLASGYSYIVSPASASFAAYSAAQIYADDVTTEWQITFHCENAPSADLTVNVVRVVAS